MDDRDRELLAGGVVVGIFALVQFGALSLLAPFAAAGYQPVENPSDPTNSLLYFVAIMVATGVMLLAIRFEVLGAIRALVVLTAGMLAWYALAVWIPVAAIVGGVDLVAFGGATLLAGALWVYPEWYVIDAAGVVMGAAAGALFGLTFGLLPAVLLLSLLAVYDAISVYGTEHMLTLAGGAVEMRVPVLLVVPTAAGYSFIEATSGDGKHDASRDGEGAAGEADEGDASGRSDPDVGEGADRDSGESRPVERVEPAGSEDGDGLDGARDDDGDDPDVAGDDDGDGPDGAGDDEGDHPDGDAEELVAQDALYVGLGDAVMPTIMVASAAMYADAPSIGVPWLLLNGPALGAIAGTMVGLVALLWLVFRGRAHAGLPLLNGGAIAGYLAVAVASGIPVTRALGL